MKKIKVKNVIVLLIGAFALITVTYIYGRSFWHPVYNKFLGKQTARGVVNKYEKAVAKRLKNSFIRAKLTEYPTNLTFIILKKERKLEVWSKVNNKNIFIKSYPMTAFSGKLGPKLKDGDRQIPEGIYKITYLNPNSSYHLSMRLNYPNTFDKKMAKRESRTNLGCDIMIHGKAVTIGCIPVGNKGVEELFILAYKAGIKNITVLSSPQDFRINDEITKNNRQWVNTLYGLLKSKLTEYKKQAE